MVTLIIFPDFFARLSFVAWGDKLSYVFLIYLIFWNIKTLEFVVNEMKIWPGANNCWKIIKTKQKQNQKQQQHQYQYQKKQQQQENCRASQSSRYSKFNWE